MALRDERGLAMIHAYDDPDVIAGQGTVGLEVLEDLPEVDVVVVGAGGGGLVSGIASAVKAVRPGLPCLCRGARRERRPAPGRGGRPPGADHAR